MNAPMKLPGYISAFFLTAFWALPLNADAVRVESRVGNPDRSSAVDIVVAHKGATGFVKKRMNRMEAIGAEMKQIGAMVRGKKRFDGSKIAAASERIAQHGRKLNRLFPKGSLKKPTQASPKVWKDWRGFTRDMNTMVRSATVLAEAGRAGNKNRARAAYIALGKSCIACHRTYRLKKKKHR